MHPNSRGWPHPTPHPTPGGSGFPANPPYAGTAHPPHLMPPEIITLEGISEVVQQKLTYVLHRFSDVEQGYADMNKKYDESLRQTDRILAEQAARFEARLDNIATAIRQSHENEMAAIATLRQRLESLEGSEIAYRKNADCSLYGSERFPDEFPVALPPAAVLSEPGSPLTSSRGEPESVAEVEDQLSWSSTSDTVEPLASPTTCANNTTVVSVSPRATSPEGAPDTPPPQDPPSDAAQDPLQYFPLEDLFDAPSPLTQISSSCSQDEDALRTPTPLSEDITPMLYSPPPNAVPRKRKRSSYRPKRSQKTKRSRHQVAGQDPLKENRADPSVWPPTIEGGINRNQYISCDRCAGWFHFGCVALEGDHEDGTPWECPPCTGDPTRGVVNGLGGGGRCSRPGCDLSTTEEFFMDRLLGRCYDQNVTKYLVSYEGYGLLDCTWEPAENFANDSSKINEFLDWWATENPTVDMEFLDPKETIFIRDAYNYARQGVEWPGAS